MSGRSATLRGPRRTRVYDCNYNMGESYYKPALDNLDRKYNREWVHFFKKILKAFNNQKKCCFKLYVI